MQDLTTTRRLGLLTGEQTGTAVSNDESVEPVSGRQTCIDTLYPPSADPSPDLADVPPTAGSAFDVAQLRAVPDATLTILFTDIEGFTAITQRLGDQRAQDVLRAHNAIVREQVASHGGLEVKSQGDGFMIAFASARRALQCAIDLQCALARHNESAETALQVRMGLNAGEPIVEDEDLFGTAVILAARIAAKADGGEILAANVVRELVAGKGFLFGDWGDTALRGFEDPVRLFDVRWRAD
jgi:class 3 adenylate cyclase